MFHLTIVAVGRLRDPHLAALCRDFGERLGRHDQVDVAEVRAFRGDDPPRVMAREAEAILKRIRPEQRLIALHRGGRSFTSFQLAAWMERQALAGHSRLTFVIGGAFGLDPGLLERAQLKLSLSKMTFPHELARLLLLEQLYRALSILRGEPYHKGGA